MGQVTLALAQRDVALDYANQGWMLRHFAMEASANAMLITSAVGPEFVIEYANPAFERITGYASADIIGHNCKFLQAGDHDQPGLAHIRIALHEQREANAVLRNYRKDGSLFWNHIFIAPVRDVAGAVTHFVASQYDITALKEYEQQLLYQATHDELTGLPNRLLLRDRLLQALAAAGRNGDQIWVAFLKLGRVQMINDTIGHAAGDTLLNRVAAGLRRAVRSADTVARWGGSEFVVIMVEQTDGTLAASALQRMLDAVTRPLLFQNSEFQLSAHIGVAVSPLDGDKPDVLLDRADIALGHAVRTGPSNFCFHTADMNARVLHLIEMESALRRAIAREEFVLHYQAQVDLDSGRIVGMEALIRWQHPERGLIYPGDFIAIAEENGLIEPIGTWVLRTACRQNRAWQHAGLPRLRVAVNLSARQFGQAGLVELVAATLTETGLAAQDLEIELTESLVMADVEKAIRILRNLKAQGVQLAIDDFGTGYSSLAYLRRFPLDVLKIDRSFVTDIVAEDGIAAAIVNSIIMLAQALKLKVIAEGVETEAQSDYLREHGCTELQGYYFSRPLDADAFAALRRSGKTL